MGAERGGVGQEGQALGGRLGPVLVGAVELFSLTPLLTADRFGLVLAAGAAGWGGLRMERLAVGGWDEEKRSVVPLV